MAAGDSIVGWYIATNARCGFSLEHCGTPLLGGKVNAAGNRLFEGLVLHGLRPCFDVIVSLLFSGR